MNEIVSFAVDLISDLQILNIQFEEKYQKWLTTIIEK